MRKRERKSSCDVNSVRFLSFFYSLGFECVLYVCRFVQMLYALFQLSKHRFYVLDLVKLLFLLWRATCAYFWCTRCHVYWKLILFLRNEKWKWNMGTSCNENGVNMYVYGQCAFTCKKKYTIPKKKLDAAN